MSRLSIPERHQLKVARDTMRWLCCVVGKKGILGGTNHREAQRVIRRLTRKSVALPDNCSCDEGIIS